MFRNHENWCSFPFSRMMLQHTGPSLADISCSALVPCLSPPGTLTLDDFTNFTPIVKEELRLAIQNKRLSSGLSADVSSDGASSSSDRPSEHLAAGLGGKREVRFFSHDLCLCVSSVCFLGIEILTVSSVVFRFLLRNWRGGRGGGRGTRSLLPSAATRRRRRQSLCRRWFSTSFILFHVIYWLTKLLYVTLNLRRVDVLDSFHWYGFVSRFQILMFSCWLM